MTDREQILEVTKTVLTNSFHLAHGKRTKAPELENETKLSSLELDSLAEPEAIGEIEDELERTCKVSINLYRHFYHGSIPFDHEENIRNITVSGLVNVIERLIDTAQPS